MEQTDAKEIDAPRPRAPFTRDLDFVLTVLERIQASPATRSHDVRKAKEKLLKLRADSGAGVLLLGSGVKSAGQIEAEEKLAALVETVEAGMAELAEKDATIAALTIEIAALRAELARLSSGPVVTS